MIELKGKTCHVTGSGCAIGTEVIVQAFQPACENLPLLCGIPSSSSKHEHWVFTPPCSHHRHMSKRFGQCHAISLRESTIKNVSQNIDTISRRQGTRTLLLPAMLHPRAHDDSENPMQYPRGRNGRHFRRRERGILSIVPFGDGSKLVSFLLYFTIRRRMGPSTP